MSAKKQDHKVLHVSSGVARPESINQKAAEKFKQKKRKVLHAEAYVKGILEGDRTILGMAITLTESILPQHQHLSREVIVKCLPYSGNAMRIGITGVPGVGKSSFIENLGSKLTKQGKKIAVLAIDPSSDRSKGSILGDKTRMESLAVDSNAFIRPSPSGGSLGGVARKTRESIVLCEAAGFDIVFVETVGVGQSETTVRSMVDFFLLLMLAGAGDELQGIKRGIMEMADLIAITKADGDNIKRAERARTDFQNALHLFPPTESGWIPQVVACSAMEDRGINEIWSLVNEYFKLSKANEYFEQNRRQQAKYWMHEFILDNLKANFYNHPEITKKITDFEEQIKNTKITSYYAAQELLDQYFRSG